MESIYDNIIFDYGIYDPRPELIPTESYGNSGITIGFAPAVMTITFEPNLNVLEPLNDKLTLTIQ